MDRSCSFKVLVFFKKAFFTGNDKLKQDKSISKGASPQKAKFQL